MKDTIEMAREAGLSIKEPQWGYTETHHVAGWLDNLKRFEALIRADEREFILNLVQKMAARFYKDDAEKAFEELTEAIRAMGDT